MIHPSLLWTIIELALVIMNFAFWMRLFFFPDSKNYFALTCVLAFALCIVTVRNVLICPGEYVPVACDVVVAILAAILSTRAFLWMLFGRQKTA